MPSGTGEFPIVFAPCETVDPVALAWLLAHGANPNCARPQRRYPGTALDNVLGSYVRRSADLSGCIDMLLGAGAVTKHMVPAVMDVIRNRIDLLAPHLDADPSLLRRRFPELDFGTTGGRRLTLRGAPCSMSQLSTATSRRQRSSSIGAPTSMPAPR
jgi:hypothetical protein